MNEKAMDEIESVIEHLTRDQLVAVIRSLRERNLRQCILLQERNARYREMVERKDSINVRLIAEVDTLTQELSEFKKIAGPIYCRMDAEVLQKKWRGTR